jgi:hypothetical protein
MALSSEQLFAHVRSLYCFYRCQFVVRTTGRDCDFGSRPIPRYDGGTDSDGRHYQPVWPRLTRFILEKELDLLCRKPAATINPT